MKQLDCSHKQESARSVPMYLQQDHCLRSASPCSKKEQLASRHPCRSGNSGMARYQPKLAHYAPQVGVKCGEEVALSLFFPPAWNSQAASPKERLDSPIFIQKKISLHKNWWLPVVHVYSMAETFPTLAQCAIVAGAFKILLFPA